MEAGERNIYDADTIIQSHIHLGNVDEALAAVTEFSDLLDERADDWGTRNVVGWALFLEGRVEEASPVMEAWAVWAAAEMAEGRPTLGHIWDTLAHVRAALGNTEGAREAFVLAFENTSDREWARELYGPELTQGGFDIGEGDEGIIAALEACAATGPACRLIPDDEDPANQ